MKKRNKVISNVIPDEIIINKIFLIRGQKIMLDTDLAELYQIETRRLNEQVKRNLKRFPSDFMFQLTEKELEILMSQIATSRFSNNSKGWGGIRKLPYVFTEHGVLMLSSVLNSDRAIEVNINIMRIFSRIRQMLMDNTELRLAFEEIKKKTENNTKNIEVVFQYLDELLEKRKNPTRRKAIGYKIPAKKS